MTALLDSPNPAPPSPEPGGQGGFHLQRISANLLPDEIIATRRLSQLKRKIALGIALLVALIAVGYGYSWWQTRQASDNLASEQFATDQLTTQQQKFAPLVQAQADTESIKSKLTLAMTDDLQWANLMAILQKSAGPDVTISSLIGSVDADAAAAIQPLNNTGLQLVGTLKVSGTATDYRSVAAFVDRLSLVKGLAVVDPASVTDDGKQLTFNVSLSLTTDALGGLFKAVTPPATTEPSAAPTGGQ
ncbi:MAG TPA: hypothetical protein VGH30_05390 [Jatrophihabitantaceae bacterium]